MKSFNAVAMISSLYNLPDEIIHELVLWTNDPSTPDKNKVLNHVRDYVYIQRKLKLAHVCTESCKKKYKFILSKTSRHPDTLASLINYVAPTSEESIIARNLYHFNAYELTVGARVRLRASLLRDTEDHY